MWLVDICVAGTDMWPWLVTCKCGCVAEGTSVYGLRLSSFILCALFVILLGSFSLPCKHLT